MQAAKAEPVEPIYVTKKAILSACPKIHQIDLDRIMARYEIQVTNGLFNVFDLISGMGIQIKGKFGVNGGVSNSDLDIEKRREEVMKLRIINQERLRRLIPIEDAKIRVKKAFLAVAKYIQHGTKATAPRVAICQDVRECERIMLAGYDNALNLLEKEATIISWEQDSAKTQLRGTELFESSAEDSGNTGSAEDKDTSEGEHTESDRPQINPVFRVSD